MKERAGQILVGMLLLGRWLTFGQPAPPNDDFEDRIVLTGSSVTFTGTLQNATIQTGEPAATSAGSSWPYGYGAAAQNASVWWSWVASTSGAVTIEVLSASTNTLKLGAVEAWTGTNWSSGFALAGGTVLDTGRHPFFTFSATLGMTYQLRVVGTNFGDFTLRLTETNTPIIVVQPLSRTVPTNGSVFFGVVTAGSPPFSPPFSYQWRSNGIDLAGETFPILSMDNLTTSQSGGYSVLVSNAFGATISEIAVLNVTEVTTPPRLTSLASTGGQFRFGILGDFGRLYRVQSTTNLANWVEEKVIPSEFIYYHTELFRSRNGLVYDNEKPLALGHSMPQKFYRTTTYTPSLAACINNLAKIRFAKEIWSLEYKQVGFAAPTVPDVIQYLRTGGPSCPLDTFSNIWTSYTLNLACQNPICQYSFSHLLEEPED